MPSRETRLLHATRIDSIFKLSPPLILRKGEIGLPLFLTLPPFWRTMLIPLSVCIITTMIIIIIIISID